MVKKVFLVVLVGFTMVLLLRRLVKNSLGVPVPSVRINSVEISKEMRDNPDMRMCLGFLNRHTAELPPKIEEINGRTILRFGEDTFDATEIKDSKFMKSLVADFSWNPA